MNNSIFASLVILAPLMFGQMAFADNQTAAAQQAQPQIIQELTINDLLGARQDYVLEKVGQTQTRRSALFANVLDTTVKNATRA